VHLELCFAMLCTSWYTRIPGLKSILDSLLAVWWYRIVTSPITQLNLGKQELLNSLISCLEVDIIDILSIRPCTTPVISMQCYKKNIHRSRFNIHYWFMWPSLLHQPVITHLGHKVSPSVSVNLLDSKHRSR